MQNQINVTRKAAPDLITADIHDSVLARLLTAINPYGDVEPLLASVAHHPGLLQVDSDQAIPRAVLAHALNLLLLQDLWQRVPLGAAYVREKVAAGDRLVFDHGALRTVRWHNQSMPSGQLAFARILRPLGFGMVGEYPLPRLNMCGFVYRHQDYPQDIAQFFVSEFYPEAFSKNFQQAVDRIVSQSVDPLGPEEQALLTKLEQQGELNLMDAVQLLPTLATCFGRQHPLPSLEDYQILLAESAEMAWIATEGNAFNHATDRVPDLARLEAQQKALGRPMKPEIEIAENVNIRQTAYRAEPVLRQFDSAQGKVELSVPGSFFEFIERGSVGVGTSSVEMDLRFDSRNAQGIFGMTRK